MSNLFKQTSKFGGLRKVQAMAVNTTTSKRIMKCGQGSSNVSELKRSIKNPAIGSRRMSSAL